MSVKQWSQPDGRWILTDIDGMDGEVRLQSMDGRLELLEVYDKIDFSRAASSDTPRTA